MAQITEVPPLGKRKSPLRELLETVALALIIALIVRTFVVEVYRVDGSSMEHTLYSGERVLVNKFLFRWVRGPGPGEIIVFRSPRDPHKDFIKRVVAVAGDKVELKAGRVYVNGQLFPEVSSAILSDEDLPGKVVPPESVWVLGDNRNNSFDSRSFQAVPLENIRGLGFFRIWPLGKLCRFINPAEAAGAKAHGFMVCR